MKKIYLIFLLWIPKDHWGRRVGPLGKKWKDCNGQRWWVAMRKQCFPDTLWQLNIWIQSTYGHLHKTYWYSSQPKNLIKEKRSDALTLNEKLLAIDIFYKRDSFFNIVSLSRFQFKTTHPWVTGNTNLTLPVLQRKKLSHKAGQVSKRVDMTKIQFMKFQPIKMRKRK